MTAATVSDQLLGILGPAAGVSADGFEVDARLLVGGALRESSSGARFDNVNPATGEVIGTVPDGTPADLDEAIGAAREAFDSSPWAWDVELRARCLRQMHEALVRHVDELRTAMVLELGCPVRLATSVQVGAAVEKFGFFADAAVRAAGGTDLPDEVIGGFRSVRSIVREPIGVVGAITPWNIPLDISLAKIGGALAAGNAVVHKPAPDTPWTAAIVARLVAEETDIPAGVVNVVLSSDHALGAQLTDDPRVDTISFTGSTATGRRVMAAAAAAIKKVHLELGGKSPNLVLDDAALEHVVPLAAALGTFNAGQSCILPSRLLVPLDRLDECTELAARGLEGVPVGDPLDPDVFMGPLVNEAHRSRVLGMIEAGVEGGAEVVTGGGTDAFDGRPGYFMEPTLIAAAEPDSMLVQEEIFGPVVTLQAYRDLDHAVELANGTPFGLAAYVWSSDPERAGGVARRLRAGMVGINGGQFTGADMPFGGVGQSGLGREWGDAGVEEFQEIKTISTGMPA